MIDGFTCLSEWYTVADVLVEFILALIGVYMVPIFVAIAHDSLELLLLPIRKLIDWFRKPAQQLDIDIKNRE